MSKTIIRVMTVLCLVFFAGSLYAGDAVIMTIKPPGAHEPIGNFEGNGILQRVTNTSVVINDALYHLSPGVTYHNYDGSLSSADAFPVGIRVWFVLSIDDDNTVMSLWKEGG